LLSRFAGIKKEGEVEIKFAITTWYDLYVDHSSSMNYLDN